MNDVVDRASKAFDDGDWRTARELLAGLHLPGLDDAQRAEVERLQSILEHDISARVIGGILGALILFIYLSLYL